MKLAMRAHPLLVCMLLLLAVLCGSQLRAADQVAVPPLSAHVTDLTGTLTAEQKSALENTVSAFEQKKGSQIAVLLIPTTQPETIEEFSIRVVDAWKLGRKGIDDGVLLTIAKNDRAVRIEVGRGLEGVLTDAMSNRIIRNVITPRFRNGEFYEGVNDGVTSIIQVINGEPLPEPAVTSTGRYQNNNRIPWPFLIIAVVVGGSILRSIFGRFGAAGITGVGVSILMWMFIGTLIGSVIAGVVAFIFVLAGGGRGGGWTSGPRGWGGGGFGGGGFGGGGGWGGGGGGGFSGGGSSGRW